MTWEWGPIINAFAHVSFNLSDMACACTFCSYPSSLLPHRVSKRVLTIQYTIAVRSHTHLQQLVLAVQLNMNETPPSRVWLFPRANLMTLEASSRPSHSSRLAKLAQLVGDTSKYALTALYNT